MNATFPWVYQQWQLRAILPLLWIGVLVMSIVVPVHAQEEIRNLHPAIVKLAEENPNEPLRVIVQQNAREGIARETLSRSGGTVLETLPIINGMVMELPARAVVELARSRGVRWITLDAPVVAGSLPGNLCNLLTNPGFENGFDSWNDPGGTLDKTLSGQSHTGAFAVQLGSPAGALSQSLTSAQAGHTYQASGTFKRNSSSGLMFMGIDFLDANWHEISHISVPIPDSTDYRAITVSGVAPAGTVHLSLWIWKDSGGSLYLDNLSVQDLTTLSSECSGFTPSGGENLLENGGFADGFTNWYKSSSAEVVTTGVYMGAKAVRLGQGSGSIAQAAEHAIAGQTYTANGMFRRPPGSPWSGIGIDFFDDDWEEIDETYIAIPESNNYIPVSISGIAPTGTEHISVWIYKNSGGSLYIDEISLVAGDVPDAYVQSTGADLLWHEPTPLNGEGITVAVVDSGIADHQDLYVPGTSTSRVIHAIDLTNNGTTSDIYGHGTHVAGIIAGNGTHSYGIHKGIAPGANLLNLRISNGQGMTYTSDLIAGLQWLFEHKDTYNIRVANLSLNSTVPESYHTSPISAAVELLWFSGITVVVSAGNNGTADGPATLYAPANDPFVITVGATNDRNTGTTADDFVEAFSTYGQTIDGFAKPDLVAPGRNIISLTAGTNSTMAMAHPAHNIGSNYFRMSGTSMAAPVVSGVVALLLQDEPNLTPDQVKYRLKATAGTNWAGYDASKAGAGEVNAYAAIHGTTTATANTGVAVSQMLFTGDDPVAWDSVSWNSVSWNSVSWNSVSWNSVSWNSVSWNSVSWASSIWDDWLISDVSTDTAPTPIPIMPLNATTTETEMVNLLYLPLVTR